MSHTTLLTIHSDAGKLRQQLAPGSYVIGRDASCDVVVPSIFLAPRHARIHIAADHFSVEDLSGASCSLTAAGRRHPIPKSLHLGDLTIEVGEESSVEIEEGLNTEPFTQPRGGSSHPGEHAGDTLDDYALVERLGEGGFGTVWRARQAKPVRRDVALKILKPGMDSREVLGRFDQERQVLARMSHPGIAKVFDAGATSQGRPYFVMEWVRGTPLTTYAREQRLDLQARLRLFTRVCIAVNHAHQKGVIHRDLKPSNLLVTEIDGTPTPKVIDFGIAKAAGGEKLTDLTVVTLQEQLIGTPAYMSPEQARRIPGDIDTRSDIYSLGVVLYEIMTGTTPFRDRELLGTSGDEMFKIIQETIPERPSTRIRALQRTGDCQPGSIPEGAGEMSAGDLDWIVMRCLEREPERRYESAAALAEDIEAFLDHRPVTARPPSLVYLTSRFAQRNKLAVTAATAVLTAVFAGLGFSSVMYFRERDARKQAETETEKSRQVAQFLKDTLSAVGPSVAMGRDTKLMREILDKTADRIGTELKDRPGIRAELSQVIGNAYNDLRVFSPAVAQLKEALRIQRELHPEDHPELAACLMDYAAALEMAGKVKEAAPFATEGTDMWRRVAGKDDPHTAGAETLVAWILLRTGHPKDGEVMAEHAMEIWRMDPADRRLSEAPNTLATIYEHTRRNELAVKIYAEELAGLRRVYGQEHPLIENCLDNYGAQLLGMGRADEAEPILLDALSMGRKYFGDRCPDEDHVLSGLAAIAGKRGDLEAQLNYTRQCREVGARVYPVGHRYWNESQGKYLRTMISLIETHLQRALGTPERDESRRNAVGNALALIGELNAATDLATLRKPDQPWIDCLSLGASFVKGRLDSNEAADAMNRFTRSCEAIQQSGEASATGRARRDKAGSFLEALHLWNSTLARSTGE